MMELLSKTPTATGLKCPCCSQEILDTGAVMLDREGGFVVAGGEVVSLTVREMGLFLELWDERPKTLHQERLLNRLYWQRAGGEVPEIKIIDVLVCKLRRKLVGMPVAIETVWGHGYRIKLEHGGVA